MKLVSILLVITAAVVSASAQRKPNVVIMLADNVGYEPIWRLDDKYMSIFRLRGGLGYIFSKKWRAEMIYHAEFTGNKGEPKKYTGNIWRLNIKLTLPRRGARHTQDIDID